MFILTAVNWLWFSAVAELRQAGQEATNRKQPLSFQNKCQFIFKIKNNKNTTDKWHPIFVRCIFQSALSRRSGVNRKLLVKAPLSTSGVNPAEAFCYQQSPSWLISAKNYLTSWGSNWLQMQNNRIEHMQVKPQFNITIEMMKYESKYEHTGTRDAPVYINIHSCNTD